MAPKPQWWRAFDREYWQMRTALGYGGPTWADRRFKLTFGQANPFKCGKCEARERFPGLHVAYDLCRFNENLKGVDREDFEHRVGLALAETGIAKAEAD